MTTNSHPPLKQIPCIVIKITESIRQSTPPLEDPTRPCPTDRSTTSQCHITQSLLSVKPPATAASSVSLNCNSHLLRRGQQRCNGGKKTERRNMAVIDVLCSIPFIALLIHHFAILHAHEKQRLSLRHIWLDFRCICKTLCGDYT